jgi:hypothetical protein
MENGARGTLGALIFFGVCVRNSGLVELKVSWVAALLVEG